MEMEAELLQRDRLEKKKVEEVILRKEKKIYS